MVSNAADICCHIVDTMSVCNDRDIICHTSNTTPISAKRGRWTIGPGGGGILHLRNCTVPNLAVDEVVKYYLLPSPDPWWLFALPVRNLPSLMSFPTFLINHIFGLTPLATAGSYSIVSSLALILLNLLPFYKSKYS